MTELSKQEFLARFGSVDVKFSNYKNKNFTFNSIEGEKYVAVSVDRSAIDSIFVDDIHHVKDLNIFSGMATVGEEVYHFYEVI